MEGVVVTSGLLDWSQSVSGKRCGLGAVDEGCHRVGCGVGFGMGSREQVKVHVTGHVSRS